MADPKNCQEGILAEIHKIRQELEKLNGNKLLHTYNSGRRLVFFQLMKGVAFGFGSVMGASVVVSFFIFLLSQVEFIPIIGEYLSQLIEEIKLGQE